MTPQGYYYPPQDVNQVQLPNYPQQTRQFSYFFVQNINEAYNWAIAPGNFLVFKDQDGIHFYTKSLGLSPYDKVQFEVYTKEQPQAEMQAPVQQTNTEYDSLKEEISKLKEAMKKLNNKITDKKVGDY